MKRLIATFTLLGMLSGFIVPAFADNAPASAPATTTASAVAAPLQVLPPLLMLLPALPLLPHPNAATRALTVTRVT